ncbi:MAG: HAMP domain-containing histidine kinase [Planctomycetes bacterium]|jgi:C4-dicarboxylate-specific signal transduction histidine kinase|nr:HAMP domain-containing histidine kinase [Planctomycetota bacterium]
MINNNWLKIKTSLLDKQDLEKLNQLYRLAEFGRLSGGLFHDLMNPLSAVCLNLEAIKQKKQKFSFVFLDNAILAAKKVESLISSLKQQLRCDLSEKYFSLNEELKQIINILSYRLRKEEIILEVKDENARELQLYGPQTKFSQVLINLLTNAIDAYKDELNFPTNNSTTSLKPKINNRSKKVKKIIISVNSFPQFCLINISDNACGISPQNINAIFEPFFTTKKEQGLGIGLFTTKNIIEQDFKGNIKVTSVVNKGTVFTLILPIKKN